MKHFIADITVEFSALSFDRFVKAQALTKKQRDDIKSTMTTCLEAADGFLRSIDSKLSWPGSST